MTREETAIRNEMILASAGSGKTYQLTNRYIGLMALGVDPERIIALTFTRKAAGEFFDSILRKLAGAATDPETCRSLAESPYIPELTCEDYRILLRKVVDRMHLLFLGTLDSFFVSIVHSFPFEFGLSGDFEILDDHLAALETERVYRSVFRRRGVNEKDRHAFLEAFKLATFGKEESRVFNDLNRFVDKQHDIFLGAPGRRKWGIADAIWPGGCPWIAGEVRLPGEFDRLFQIFEGENLNGKQWNRWRAFREAAENHAAGGPMTGELEYLLKNLLAIWGAIESGENAAPVVERRKQPLTPGACECLRRIVNKIVGGEITTRLNRTQGVWTVLDRFESAYGHLVRRRGKLTFNDLQLILAGQELEEAVSRGRVLSQRPGTASHTALAGVAPGPGAGDRLNIDYRLDGRFDHWLFDEFQDTNRLQWRVVENLIDEIMQDTSGERTYFQVGDVKQAIYGWRGGDTRLFFEVQDRYNVSGEERIVPRELDDSWRSCPAVIDMVNDVFGDEPALRELYPAAAIERWKWGKHVSKHPELAGYAALLNPPAPAGKGARHRLEDNLAIALAILEEIQPVKNGLSCAVLLQTNPNIARTVDYFREHSKIPVLNESEITIAKDSALNLALLSLLKFAAHPGDTFAWWHLRMTPFDTVFEKRKLNRSQIVAEVTRDIHRHGFEATLRGWIEELREKEGDAATPVRPAPLPKLDLDPFTRRRAAELLLAAQQFDDTGSRNITEFLRFAEKYSIREADTKGLVNVMTIHKSKGLGFDVVILPDLGGNALTTVRDGIAVHRHPETRETEWIFDLPAKYIAECDPVLAAHLENESAEECYESLCKFYVALTRAKRALYCITPLPPRKFISHNFVMLLEKTLRQSDARPFTIGDTACDLVYSRGEPDWHNTLHTLQGKSAKSAVKKSPAAKPHPGQAARLRPIRRTPSGSETHTISARQLFSRAGKRARDYGTAVHALFEQIAWLDEIEDSSAHYEIWERNARIPEPVGEAVRNEVLACLEDKEIVAALSQPGAFSELWRERRFEIILDGHWFSGTFDRVVLEKETGGPSWTRAAILDFKTNHIDPENAGQFQSAVDSYRPQLETYRRVLSRMTGLEESAIACRLLFTRPRRIVTLDA